MVVLQGAISLHRWELQSGEASELKRKFGSCGEANAWMSSTLTRWLIIRSLTSILSTFDIGRHVLISILIPIPRASAHSSHSSNQINRGDVGCQISTSASINIEKRLFEKRERGKGSGGEETRGSRKNLRQS